MTAPLVIDTARVLAGPGGAVVPCPPVTATDIVRVASLTQTPVSGSLFPIGTTTVRALETWSLSGEQEGRSGLFIRRPFDWRVVDLMMTNFHLPRSTLLCLVSAFAGRERVLAAYAEAVTSGYRFYSYGDAMLIA